MASIISLSNKALTILGANLIISTDENSDEARAVNAIFQSSLDTLLMMHPWNFAINRERLSQLATSPEYEYEYEYSIPSSPYCLKVLDVYPEDAEYRIEGRKLLTDEATVSIKYIGRVADMNTLSPLFQEALVYYLAGQLAYKIEGSGVQADKYFTLFDRFILQARVRDSQEGTPKEQETPSWITSRWS